MRLKNKPGNLLLVQAIILSFLLGKSVKLLLVSTTLRIAVWTSKKWSEKRLLLDLQKSNSKLGKVKGDNFAWLYFLAGRRILQWSDYYPSNQIREFYAPASYATSRERSIYYHIYNVAFFDTIIGQTEPSCLLLHRDSPAGSCLAAD